MLKKRWLIAVGAPVAALAVGSGVAFALWSAQGSGSGSGAATVAQSLTVLASTPTGSAATLYPGGPAGQVDFTINNPNPYPVTITGISWGTPTSGSPSSCASLNISLDAGAPTTVSLSVAANSVSGPFVVPGVLDLSSGAGNGCEGQTFNIPVTVTGTQQ